MASCPATKLRDRVGKCSLVAERDVVFDDRGLAGSLGDDERARMRHDLSAGAGGDIQKMDGLLDNRRRGECARRRHLPRAPCSAR